METTGQAEAQTRCCSDGRNYRIIDSRTNQIAALIDTSSCRLDHCRAALMAPGSSVPEELMEPKV